MPLRARPHHLFGCTLLAALVLSACHQIGNLFMTNDEDEPRIPVNNNPQPTRAYRLTMAIANAPGPFADVSGGVQYDVENAPECGIRNPATGTFSRMTHIPNLEWRLTQPNTYESTVYADLLQNEDYFDRGICRWKLIGANATLRATGDEKETRFQPALDDDEIYGEMTKTLYFWKGGYPTDNPPPSDGRGFPEFGDADLDRVPAERRNEFFIVTLTARKAQP
jgi:hypothetical protein